LPSVSVEEKQQEKKKPRQQICNELFSFFSTIFKDGCSLDVKLDPVCISEHEKSPVIKFEEIKSYFNTPILNNLKKFHFKQVKTFYVIFIV